MTLGMSAVVQGLILVYTQGSPKGRAAPILRDLVTKPFVFGIPGILFIWLVVTVIMYILLSHTSFGRRLYAVGSNRVSAHLSGISVNGMLVLTYALCGFFSALAGFFFVGYTSTVFMNIGGDYVMRSVAAVVIGGTSWLAGKLLWFGGRRDCAYRFGSNLDNCAHRSSGPLYDPRPGAHCFTHLLWTSTAVKAINWPKGGKHYGKTCRSGLCW